MRNSTDKAEISETDITRILQSAAYFDYRNRVMKLKGYYSGAHAIQQKQGRENAEANNKLVSNYASYITNISVGFFLGQPISYKVAGELEKEFEPLREVYKYNDEAAHNVELAEEAAICGESYELLYLDKDAQIRFTTLPAEEVILITDTTLEENITCALRLFRVYDLDGYNYQEYADVYSAEEVRHYRYNYGALTFLSSEPNYFDEVPIIEYPNNRQRRGDFEDVISLIDAYNLTQSLSLDDLQDFTDAFLVLKNLHIYDDEQAKDLRRRKIIEVDNDGAASWLIKNLNDTYIENLKKRLQGDIHKFSAVPDMSDDSFASNASGVAIKYKLLGLEQIRARKEREFKKALQRRVELIGGIMKLKNLPAIDFRRVEVQFTANIPANLQEVAQVVTQLDGVVSQRTLLSLLPFIEDVNAEIKELEGEENNESF